MHKTTTLLFCLVGAQISCSKSENYEYVEDTSNYEYVEDTSRIIGVELHQMLLLGKLDAAGNFIQNPGSFPFKAGGAMSPGAPNEIINCRAPGKEHVYELRSGRLIKGELDKEGNFIPDLGSKVLDFKDYRFKKKDPVYIYNLPGYFKEKKEKPE